VGGWFGVCRRRRNCDWENRVLPDLGHRVILCGVEYHKFVDVVGSHYFVKEVVKLWLQLFT